MASICFGFHKHHTGCFPLQHIKENDALQGVPVTHGSGLMVFVKKSWDTLYRLPRNPPKTRKTTKSDTFRTCYGSLLYFSKIKLWQIKYFGNLGPSNIPRTYTVYKTRP